MKKTSIATLLLALVCLSPAAAQDTTPQTPPPCSDEAYRQFDFWVGDWEVETPDGQAAGTNRIERILNDCVLVENWKGTGGSVGKSFNMYYAADESWRQTWVDGNGGRLDLKGGLVGDAMVLTGKMPGRNGGTALHEITWTPLEDGRVRQHWRVSTDDGESWRDAFVGLYSKR